MNSVQTRGDSAKNSSGIRCRDREAIVSDDRTKHQQNGKGIGLVEYRTHYIIGRNWEMVLGYPRMKLEVKSGSKTLSESAKGGSATHKSGQERAARLNAIQIRNEKVFNSIRSVKLKSDAHVSSKVIGNCPLKLAFCGICMDKKAETEMFKSSCSHSFCLACIGNHVAAKIRDNVIALKCPDLACLVLMEPQNCKSFVPSQVIDRWEAALCESSLGSKKFYCPFKDCSALLISDGQETVTSAECPHCHRLFCAQCRVAWHAGLDCKSVKSKIMDKKFIDLAKKQKWQKCPSCKFYVQRTQGCECMTCRCGYKFCYICGNGWAHGHLCPT